MIKNIYTVIKDDNLDTFKELLEVHSIEELEFFYKESLIASCGSYNAIDICQYLYNLDVLLDHTYDDFDKTSLHKAVFNGHEELVSWLLEHGASPDGNLMTYSTPITDALYMIERILMRELSETHTIYEEIVQGYGQIELILDDQEYLKFKRIIIKLLEYDADPNIMNHLSCKTPLDQCFYSNNKDIAVIMRKYGAGYAHLDINDTDKKDNQILVSINDNIGKVLSVYFKYSFIKKLEIMIALLNSNTELKLLITNGLDKTKLNSEIGFIVDKNIPVAQQIIDDNYSYSFFEKLPLLIANQVSNLKIELFEGLIIEPSDFPDLIFPSNLNALIFINQQIDDINSIWLLVPIKYPRSRKFTPTTLRKFVTGLKNKKWQKLAYMLEKDDECNYIPIFK